jgi:hypothetical protein
MRGSQRRPARRLPLRNRHVTFYRFVRSVFLTGALPPNTGALDRGARGLGIGPESQTDIVEANMDRRGWAVYTCYTVRGTKFFPTLVRDDDTLNAKAACRALRPLFARTDQPASSLDGPSFSQERDCSARGRTWDNTREERSPEEDREFARGGRDIPIRYGVACDELNRRSDSSIVTKTGRRIDSSRSA